MSESRDRIQPLIVGRGMAGHALAHALAMYPEAVGPASWHQRGAALPRPDRPDRALLVVANPHALHAPLLLEGAATGYRYAVCEKPAAVDLAQVEALAALSVETWICHGYRLLWGPQELRKAVEEGRFGKLISVEGRYWQSSATRRRPGKAWNLEPELAGRFDVLLDLATHWADLVTFLVGSLPDATSVRRWYVNAASPHLDTHVHLTMSFGDTQTIGSVSKTVHGAGNELELHVLGEKAAASWRFQQPDVIAWGEGGETRTQSRPAAGLPARPAPFHGLGWMEGYGRLIGQVLGRMLEGRPVEATTLGEHLGVLRVLLQAAESEEGA